MKLLVYFITLHLACVTHASEQISFSLDQKAEDPVKRDAFYIFSSVHHLLRQWGNTLSPNGFSFTRATIPLNTNLYHARGDEHRPVSPEWLAFDSEMSYGIMFGLCNVFMRTYRTTRSLNLVYIDGNSASLTFTGTLDSQDILRFGRVRGRRFEFEERERAEGLCAWGREFGVDGFVRQNSGFEVVKCDFEDGLELVSNLNVTRWMRDIENDRTVNGNFPCREHGPQQNLTRLEMMFYEHQPYPMLRTPPRYPHRGGRWLDSPYRAYVDFEWVRIAAAVYSGMGESRVLLDTAAFVTAYGRHGLHLSSPNTTLHRLTNLTLSAGRKIQLEVRDLFRLDRKPSGIDWRSVTDQIVLKYGDRLPELHAYLMQGSATSIQNARMLLSSALVSHFDFSLDTTASLDSCTHAFTPRLDPSWPPSETKILRAIEHVLHDICQTLLFVNEQLGRREISRSDTNTTLAISRRRVNSLMTRLDWKLWVKCEEKCALGEVCLINLWPITSLDLTAPPEPRCAGPSNLARSPNDYDFPEGLRRAL